MHIIWEHTILFVVFFIMFFSCNLCTIEMLLKFFIEVSKALSFNLITNTKCVLEGTAFKPCIRCEALQSTNDNHQLRILPLVGYDKIINFYTLWWDMTQ